MITTTNELLNSGLPVSDEVDNAKLQMALHTAENYIVRPRLTNERYIGIEENPEEYAAILNGGKLLEGDITYYFSGLKAAIHHLAYALLMRDNLNATSFGTVTKKDDYSEVSAEERLRTVVMYHTEIGLAYLKEIEQYFGIDNKLNNLNNWGEELL